MELHFVIEQSPDGYHWRLVDKEDRVIAIGGANYRSLSDCIVAIEVVRSSGTARVRESSSK
ncbi:MAG: DUF1508 domain-containing protein [Phycisphaerales bacterium]